MISLPVIGIILLAVVGLVLLVIVGGLIGAWVKALFNGAPVPMTKLVALKFAGIPFGLIVDARITAVRAGIPLSADLIASHFQAGGNVVPTVQAIIAAKKAGIALDWDRACAIDLATKGSGKSVVEAVRTSVDPKVIDCPNPEAGRTTIDGVAKDGIQVKVKARVTVRTNLDRFVGGAKENTIIARVGEGIVTTIGSAESYKTVLESPDSISKTVLARGLDAGTAFEILSIDIADVDVGENVGAKLQVAQAEANKNMAQAQAEIRRAAAVALEQEMKARTQESQAKVVEAQAQVPLAMAEAFRSGRLGVMDYYRMENIQSDTAMRGSIAGPDAPKK
ncbi:MAG TPA: flotillin-like protein FloA [Opitutaceae bacterium]|nr:flotillin-like protein FloA [Opitutaceae bacterium]